MTELRNICEVHVHKHKSLFRDSFRFSCNSPSELMTFSPAQEAAIMLNDGVTCNPVLQSFSDYPHMESNSGGSATSSTSTSAATATVNRFCNEAEPAISENQFDDCKIFYVSPSKRKSNLSGKESKVGVDGSGIGCGVDSAPLCTSLRDSKRIHSLNSVAAIIEPANPPVTRTVAFGACAEDASHDYSFDSYEVSSHYSDTALQLLLSGSCSGLVGSKLATIDANVGNSLNGSIMAQQHATPAQRTLNNVTFSSHISEQHQPLNHGSRRRHKDGSNHLLCSCDAGADTEINLDPTRPLYHYNLERPHKTHTYTCEQNAQILMRLERDRNRKLSISGFTRVYGLFADKTDNESPSTSLSDIEANTIPSLPPPPAMKRNECARSSNRTLAPVALSSSGGGGSIMSNDNNSMNFATSCNHEMFSKCNGDHINVGTSIDDCATSIVKCSSSVGLDLGVNRVDGGSSLGAYNPQSMTTGQITSISSNSGRPDVCRVGARVSSAFSKYPMPSLCDDIFVPNSQKTDPSMCFLHAGPDGVSPGASFTIDNGRPKLKKQHYRSDLNIGSKYNTIGPTSDYARQLSEYTQRKRQQQHYQHVINDRCSCYSHSLTHFSRDYLGQLGRQQDSALLGGRIKVRDAHGRRIFTADNQDSNDDKHAMDNWMNGATPLPLSISRSYGNLTDVCEDRHEASSRVPYQKLKTPSNMFSSRCRFGATTGIINSNALFAALGGSIPSGLKEKLHKQHHNEQQLQQTQLTTPPHLRQQSNHPQHNRQQQQAIMDSTQPQEQKLHHLHSSSTSIMPWKHRQCPSRGSSSSGTNSFPGFDAAKHWLAVSSILLIIGAASVAVPLALRVAASAPFEERLRVAIQLLDQVPLIDGHNDLPWNIRKFLHNKLNDFNFDEDLRNVMPWARSHWSHTDLRRLKKGRISAQFWAAYVPCEAQHRDAVQLTLEQIDVIKRLTDRYSPQLTTCTSSDDIIEAHKNHQVCSLTGVEGGHSLGGSLAVLRTLYAIGVRYMTLTSTCHTPWADSSYADAPTFNVKHGGLTIFGKTIIREMNRLGMMVDLSHVSTGTMRDALEVSEAPVIFSHSSAYELCNSSRNVQDDMLHSLTKNGGLVMVNFYSKFLSCSSNSTVHDAVAHINHIRRVAGIDHVGLGAGYDGINFTPKGLEDVSSYPTLFAELLGIGWSIEDLTKLAGGNFLRIMKQVEKLRDEKKAVGVKPYEDHPNFRTDDPYNCTSS